MSAPAPASKPPMTSLPPTARETQRPVNTPAPGQALAVDVNELPVTKAAAALYGICSGFEREALRIPWMLGEKDPRAKALQDCAIRLRAAVNDLRRDGEL